VALRALQGPRWLGGLPRYLWATLSEWRHLQHWQAQGHADGQPVGEGPMLFTSVLNTPTFGSGLPAVPQARIDDKRLDWLRVGPIGRWATLAMLPQLALGTHLRHPMVDTGRFTQLQLRCENGVPLAADGEWLGQARQVQVSVQGASLKLVRPPA
jgi:diacylglycerol kinase family enzyme